MSTPGWIKVKFIGGPLNGERDDHPLMNTFRLNVPGNTEGFYMGDSLNYYWQPTQPQEKRPVDKGGLGERWLLRLAKRVVKFLESAGVRE